MNDRLEIASRQQHIAALRGERLFHRDALAEADALIAEEARTRKPEAADAPIDSRVGKAVILDGRLHFVPIEVADELAKLRAVAEELYAALNNAADVGVNGDAAYKKAIAALAAARAMGLGGGK